MSMWFLEAKELAMPLYLSMVIKREQHRLTAHYLVLTLVLVITQ